MKGIDSFSAAKVDGLIASWSFDGVTNGGFPADQPQVPPFPADNVQPEERGVVGGCVHFTGAKEPIAAPLDLSKKITTGITVSFWVKAEQNGGAIIDLNHNVGFSMDFVQGSLRYNTQGHWGPRMNTSTISGWNHFAYTWDGQRARIYRDSLLVADVPSTRKFDAPNSVRLGGGTFNGWIDDLRIYNRALPTDVVEKIYLKGSRLGKN